jgi:hypothetical protein
MNMQNEHRQSIPANVVSEIEGLLQQILTKLEPYQTPLTAAERQEKAIVGDKTIGFIEKGREYVDLYPELIPPWLNTSDFVADFDDFHNLTGVRSLAGQVQITLSDIYYLSGSESYHAILDLYHSAKQAATRDIPNAKLVATELAKHFHHPRSRTTPAT